MRIAALDLSKTCTGWAYFDSDGGGKPSYGSWVLGSKFTSDGGVFAKLHENLADLHSVMPFDAMYVEQAITNIAVGSSYSTVFLLTNLQGHAESFASCFGLKFRIVNVSSWRPPFIGRIESQKAKADARRISQELGKKVGATKSLKQLTIARCKQLGMNPKNDNEADALGILDYAIEMEGLVAPWRANEILRTPL